MGNLDLGIQSWKSASGNPELEVWIGKSGAGNLELEIWIGKSGSGILELEIQSGKSGQGNQDLGIQSGKSGFGNLDWEVWIWESRAGNLYLGNLELGIWSCSMPGPGWNVAFGFHWCLLSFPRIWQTWLPGNLTGECLWNAAPGKRVLESPGGSNTLRLCWEYPGKPDLRLKNARKIPWEVGMS